MMSLQIKAYWSLLFCLLCILLIVYPQVTFSQASLEGILNEAIDLYKKRECQQSIDKLKWMLQSPGSIERRIKTEGHKYLALNYMELGDRDSAKREFKKALVLEPDLYLGDPAEVSPKVSQVFIDAKREYEAEVKSRRREKLLSTTALGASLRSAFVPGWGQIYRGYSIKGYSLLGIGTASLVSLVISDRSFRDAQDKYDSAGEGADFKALFSDVESRADRASTLAYVAAAVWAYNIIDSLIFGPNVEELAEGTPSREEKSKFASIRLRGDEILLSYRISF